MVEVASRSVCSARRISGIRGRSQWGSLRSGLKCTGIMFPKPNKSFKLTGPLVTHFARRQNARQPSLQLNSAVRQNGTIINRVTMFRYLIIFFVVVGVNACGDIDSAQEQKNKTAAVRFFQGVYGCDSTVVDELATTDVAMSYPIFAELFNTSVIRGRDSVRSFAAGFCSRWSDPQITVHEVIAEGDKVILVWSFSGRNVGSALPDRAATNEVHSWGGISYFRFDENGKILWETGEESDPGPIERLGSRNTKE